MGSARELGGGWTVLRMLGFILGLLMMAGFGFCSLCGLSIGQGAPASFFLFVILPGLGLSLAGFLLARRMFLARHAGDDWDERRDRRERPWRH